MSLQMTTQKSLLTYFLAILVSLLLGQKTCAQVIAISPSANSEATPTLNFVWQSKNTKGVLIFIPGGEGHLGITPDRKNLGGFYGSTLKPLSDPSLTSGQFDVVVFDSPTALPVGKAYPVSRTAQDHLSRIDSVVQYFKNKTNKPIWLMGHSNGAVSITEYYKYLKKEKRDTAIAGMVYSSARNGADFPADTHLPVLFLAHEKGGCRISTNHASRVVYDSLSKTNSEKTQYVVLKGGEEESGHPCTSGHHMFYGASDEAYKAIDAFSSEYLK
jgi:hypothetical protein